MLPNAPNNLYIHQGDINSLGYPPSQTSHVDQSQLDNLDNSDRYAQESLSSRSGSFASVESPQKQASNLPITDFQPSNGKQAYYPSALAQVLNRQRQSPSPSRSGTENRMVGPYLNKNVSNPVPGYEAAFLRGTPMFFPNEQASSKPGVPSKTGSELTNGAKLPSTSTT